MDERTTDAYLARIGAERPSEINADSLRYLFQRHHRSVPWENLNKFLNEPILVDGDFFVEQIVTRKRGGGCLELNGAFAALLRSLGFPVQMLAARLFYDGGYGVPFEHLCLRVEAPEPYLVDLGLGGFSRTPLRFDSTEEQLDVMGRFQLVPTPEGDVDVLFNGNPRYRVELRPREIVDFKASMWWHLTSPTSAVAREDYPFCWLPTEDGQIMLHRKYMAKEANEVWSSETYETDEEILAGYEKHFGIVLDRVPDDHAPERWTIPV